MWRQPPRLSKERSDAKLVWTQVRSQVWSGYSRPLPLALVFTPSRSPLRTPHKPGGARVPLVPQKAIGFERSRLSSRAARKPKKNPASAAEAIWAPTMLNLTVSHGTERFGGQSCGNRRGSGHFGSCSHRDPESVLVETGFVRRAKNQPDHCRPRC